MIRQNENRISMNDRTLFEEVTGLIDRSDAQRLAELLLSLTPSDCAHLVSRLDDDERVRLFELIPSQAAASFVRALPLALLRDVLGDLSPAAAAAILNWLPSDDQTDLLAGLAEPHASQVLAAMAPAEAQDVNRLAQYPADTAGGLMATEFLAYSASTTVGQVVADLRARASEYAQYAVQYAYVLSVDSKLQGVVRLRDLLFFRDEQPLADLPLRSPVSIPASATLGDLKNFFDGQHFFAAPVVDDDDHLLGVVSRADFEQASADQAAQTLLRFGGIIWGEEFRSMPLLSRASARLAWLLMTMLLSFAAASVVGFFEATLAEVISLAVFLPVISGMSGNAGNQSIAVSMRELSLGLVKPQEIGWVVTKEVSVGLINGLVLGLAMVAVAVLWKGSLMLGLVAAAAQTMSVLLAACLGGVIPLVLKRNGFDPAVASAPLLTTVTDATGFFLTLALAHLCLAH